MPCKTARHVYLPGTVPRLLASSCLLVLILICVRPPDGRGEAIPAAPPPPDVVWGPRVPPQNLGPAVEAPPDPWRPRGSQALPAADGGPLAPRATGDSRSESPTMKAPAEDGDVLWVPRKVAAPQNLDAPPLLPPPRPVEKADGPTPAPDDDRAVLLGAAQCRPPAKMGRGPRAV